MRVGDSALVSLEKAVAGGRMLARAEGSILLVEGGIPGELVEVQVERVQRNTAWARTQRVQERSEDRISAPDDSACGGMLYAHIRYERQLLLKADIVRDAFARIGRMPLDLPINVVPSPTDAYRMRARLHVRRGRLGFFREGTHDLCDARSTRQLSNAALDAVEALHAHLQTVKGVTVDSLELAETIDASARACHVTLSGDSRLARLSGSAPVPGWTGVSSGAESGKSQTLWGDPRVTDEIAIAQCSEDVKCVRLERHVRAFFQSNRFLVSRLAARVADLVPAGHAIDLYAGVGLFALTLAARGDTGVTAVERDDISAADLKNNALPYGERVEVQHLAVEEFVSTGKSGRAPTVLVDPPRTGLSPIAIQVVTHCVAARIVYVSCDAPTLARDARLLSDAGFLLTSIELFDLFPSTPHVEAIAVFDRRA